MRMVAIMVQDDTTPPHPRRIQSEDGTQTSSHQLPEDLTSRQGQHGRQDSMEHASLTMDDVASLMREQDAELLESIHLNGPNASGMTPMTTSLSAPAMVRDMPMLSLSETAPSTSEAPGSPKRKSRSRAGSRTQMDADKADVEHTVSRKDPPRRALSGEIWTREDNEMKEEAEDDEDDFFMLTDSSGVSQEKQSPQKDVMKRSDSMDRRLSEAAQFAEVVGDIAPADQEELRIIDEEDPSAEDDDDDDDDNTPEIRVERQDPQHPVNLPTESDHSAGNRNVCVESPRPKRRPQFPFLKKGSVKREFLDKLPDNGTAQDYVYKGICANPPEIVKRGITRGNYAQLHRKAWLEVSDKYHRYGKNLRLYYRYWERLGCPTNMFFDWLDSKGEAAGQPLPAMEECPRSQLDSDTVLYITNPEVTEGYALRFVPDENGIGQVYDVDGDPVCTGPDGWIFVLRDNVWYGAQKITSVTGHSKQRFHHSSFFGGKAVAAAGIFITDDDGYMTRLYPHSGHYRPGEAHMQRMLFFLYHEGIDLMSFEMDTQQMLHVAREKEVPKDDGGVEKTEKKKKIESLHLMPAGLVACFLAHKARFIGAGIFSQIHRIRKYDVTSVSEALDLID